MPKSHTKIIKVIRDGNELTTNPFINSTMLLSRVGLFERRANERNIAVKIVPIITPYPHIEAFAGPLLPSAVVLLLKKSLIITPTSENPIKLFVIYEFLHCTADIYIYK